PRTGPSPPDSLGRQRAIFFQPVGRTRAPAKGDRMSESHPSLPARPSLEQLKKRAKELLRAIRAADPAAIARLRGQLARDADEATLADAQLVIAREHGFASWPRLKR